MEESFTSVNGRARPTGTIASEAAVRALRNVLDGKQPIETLRPLIRAMRNEAHRRELAPEAYLVTLKREWTTLPEFAHVARHPKAVDLLAHIMAMCIEEYYRAD